MSCRSLLIVILTLTACATARAVEDTVRTYDKDAVVITGTRNEIRQKNSPVRVEVINRDRIRSTSMSTLDDLLKEQNGIAMNGLVGTGVQMMGLGPDYTMILIDGQPMVGRTAGVLDLKRISVGNVERVEIVKGPMSSMYGSEALAGVINVITQRPADGFTGRLFAQAISHEPSEVQANLMWGSDDVEVSTYLNFRGGAAYTVTVDSTTYPYPGSQDGTAQAKLRWYVPGGWKFDASARAFLSATDGAFVELVLGQVGVNQGSVERTDLNGMVGAEWTHGRARLKATSFVTSFRERYNFDVDQGGRGTVDDMIRRLSRTYMQYDLQFGDANRLTVGGEFLYDDISGTRYADTNGSDSHFYRTWVAFTQWEGLPTDWISYVLSARLDANNAYGTAINPRFSLLYKPGEHWRFGGGVGTGFRAPDFRQLYVQFSNQLAGTGYALIGAAVLGNDLKPEHSLSYDVSMRYEDGGFMVGSQNVVWNTELRGFRNEIRDQIEFYLYGYDGPTAIYTYTNLARILTQGIELNTQWALGLENAGSISLLAGYQYLYAVDREVLDAIDAGLAGAVNEPPLTRKQYRGLWNRSPHSGTLRLAWESEHHAWNANVRAQFMGTYGEQALDKNGPVISDPARKVWDRDDESVGAYTVLNATVAHTFTEQDSPSSARITVAVGVTNALDVVNPPLIPALVGRQFFVNAAYAF
jgi:outer membrane receptor for ferrienterochelin and colicins